MPETLVKIRLLKDWEYTGEGGSVTTAEAGKRLEVDAETAQKLIADKTAVSYDPEAEAEAKRAVEAAKQEKMELVEIAVAAALKTRKDTEKKTIVQSIGSSIDPKGGYKAFGEFAQDIYKTGPHGRGVTKRLDAYLKSGEMQEGDDAQGGYLVPTEFRAELLQTSLEESIMTRRATFIPMQTNRIDIPAMWDTDHTAGSFFGGVTIYRTEETAQKTRSKPTFGVVQLNLHKVTGLAAVTDSLLEDSPISLGPILQKTFGQAIGFTMDNDFINGDGVGKPIGFLNCNALVVVDKVSAQTAATLVAENVLAMYARMPSASVNNAIWIANHNTLPQLAAMTIGNYPVFLPAGIGLPAPSLSMPPYATLLGRPLFFSEKMATLGLQGDIAFVDPTQYLIGGKNGLEIKTATSIHLWFDYDLTAFRFVVRYDGVCWWKSAMTPLNGDTMSPYITLQVRS